MVRSFHTPSMRCAPRPPLRVSSLRCGRFRVGTAGGRPRLVYLVWPSMDLMKRKRIIPSGLVEVYIESALVCREAWSA